MKFKTTPPPQVGQIRRVEKFLLFPKKLDNEVRWLEWAIVVEKFGKVNYGPNDSSYQWYELCFEDKDK